MDIVAAGREPGALDILSLKIADDDERKAFRRTLAQITALYTDLVVSVAHQYPDLSPDKPAGKNDAIES